MTLGMTKGVRLLGVVLCFFKSFFSATIQIVWGIAVVFLMTGLMVYFKIDASPITTLMIIVQFIMKNWGFFFIILFLYEFITSFKDYLKDVPDIEELKSKESKVKNKKEIKL